MNMMIQVSNLWPRRKKGQCIGELEAGKRDTRLDVLRSYPGTLEHGLCKTRFLLSVAPSNQVTLDVPSFYTCSHALWKIYGSYNRGYIIMLMGELSARPRSLMTRPIEP
jgi:hypothetical protein